MLHFLNDLADYITAVAVILIFVGLLTGWFNE